MIKLKILCFCQPPKIWDRGRSFNAYKAFFIQICLSNFWLVICEDGKSPIIRIMFLITIFRGNSCVTVTGLSLFLVWMVLTNNGELDKVYLREYLCMGQVTVVLVILTVWVFLIIIVIIEKVNFLTFYKKNMFFLFFTVNLTFIAVKLSLFFVMFEITLVPILILILGWSKQPERVKAGLYIFFYTLFGSFPLLYFIFWFLGESMFSLVFFFEFKKLRITDSYFWYLIGTGGFYIKLPVYFFHIWLPKAHVEAPVRGSIILAGILLKMGGYGLYLFTFFFCSFLESYNFILMSFVIAGGVYCGFFCFRQTDIKLLVAYSSVVHISLVAGGYLVIDLWGSGGSLILMVGHGLCSSGLFFLLNILYEVRNTRSMLLNKGVSFYFSFLGLWWFFFCAANISVPTSLNFAGEVLLFFRLRRWDIIILVLLFCLNFLSRVYGVYLFSYIQFGKSLRGFGRVSVLRVLNLFACFIHFYPLFFFFIMFDFFVVGL